MSDLEDVFKAMEEPRPCGAQVRIYLLTKRTSTRCQSLCCAHRLRNRRTSLKILKSPSFAR